MLKSVLKFLFFSLLFLIAEKAASSGLSEVSNISQFQLDNHFSPTEKTLKLDFSLLGIQYFSALDSESTFQQKAEFAALYKKSFLSYDFGLDAFVGSYSSAHSKY